MFKNFVTDAALGWLRRRIPDWGGWLTMIGSAAWWLLDAYSKLSDADREQIGMLLQGNWKTITLGGAAGLISWLWSQRASFRATVKPQIVTDDGEKIATEDLPSNKRVFVDEAAKVVVEKKRVERKRQPTLIDKLFKKRVG